MLRHFLMNRIFSSLHPGNLRFHRLQTVNSYSPRLFSSTSLFSDASTDRSFMRVERDEPHRRSGTFSSEDPKRKDRWNRDEKQRGTPSSFQNQSYSKFDNYRSRSPSHSNTFNQRNNRKPFNRNSISIGQYTSFKTEIPYTESPEIKFSELQTLSSEMKSALSQSFGYEKCTPVQSAIFSKLPIENDLLVQAKTGTGKTLGFLIPSLEIIKNKTHPFGKEAKVLILSPTRELALQIHAEAKRICKPFRFGAQYLVGGESKLFQVRSLQRDRSDIVVATPGRILDCLESDSSTRNCLKNIDILVIDEADRMLEIGFKEDIEKIVSHLPEGRRTLLFSATYPKNVKELVQSTLKPGYELINTISPEDVNTVQSIKQSYHVTTMSEQFIQLHSLLNRGMNSGQPFKCIVFWNTSKMTAAMANLFRESGFRRLFELHSNKDQKHRARVSQNFRNCDSGVLFTSDVSARGVDYPGVHLVIQMGIPSSKDQYVHRIGRTGRAGKSGESLIFISPFEKPFLNELSELPLSSTSVSETDNLLDMDILRSAEGDRAFSKSSISKGASSVDPYDIQDALSSYLGFYQGKSDMFKCLPNSKSMFIEEWNQLALTLGLEKPPPLNSQARAMFLNEEETTYNKYSNRRPSSFQRSNWR